MRTCPPSSDDGKQRSVSIFIVVVSFPNIIYVFHLCHIYSYLLYCVSKCFSGMHKWLTYVISNVCFIIFILVIT